VIEGEHRPNQQFSAEDQLWPMGAVSRRTGIGEHTLRAWERRFGFPKPQRLASGHRRFSPDQVQHLLLIVKALDRGHRAGDVVPLALHELEELLRDAGVFEEESATGFTDEIVTEVFDATRRFDRDGLSGMLQRDASVLGTAAFLRDRVAPLLRAVGDAWTRGELEIRHEHFFSEVLEDQLRALRNPLQNSASGRFVVLATLPNEIHSLGLQMAALAIVASGRAVRVLGRQTPVEEIIAAAEAMDAAAVGLSVSIYSAGTETVGDIDQIRRALPDHIPVIVGGEGARLLEDLPDGVRPAPTFDDLDLVIAGLFD
jgi:DNA-binding transcriptional MerR regulator